MTKRWVTLALVAWVGVCIATPAAAQFNKKWLSAGSLHGWYAEIGAETESSGFVGSQQDGARWPGIYRFTDTQAARGLWIGAKNVTDDIGVTYDTRVVHVGPRVTGAGEFFPVEFKMISRFDPPVVFVDGGISEPEAAMANDEVDPDLPADRVIYSKVNNLLGLTMERTVMQFSQDFHDNYHITEYIFTNTGNTDGDPDIELPNQTLEDVYFFWQYRNSVMKETRYIIGNATGWGRNAMNDARGDGVLPDPEGERMRAQFTWHGNFPDFTAYDNIGGPIIPPLQSTINVAPTDTLGRLGASAFAGIVTLHADASATDDSDDVAQPSTTTWFDSDSPFTSNNDAFIPDKMASEYGIMSVGHKAPRHAYQVEPSGDFVYSNADPSLGGPGGVSFANGYGPYTIGPGESVRIVMAEAVAGLSREANSAIGRAFKAQIDAGVADPHRVPLDVTINGVSGLSKNEWVFTSRDSLFQTFHRAQANLDSDFGLPQPPLPPSQFSVDGGGDRIALTWDTYAGEPDPEVWQIYRARGAFDSTYTMIEELPGSARSFDDIDPIRGIDYYYYLTALNKGASDGEALTPVGVDLRSSRYYTQTYTPTRLKRPAGTSMDEIRIVPNPFNIGSSPDVRWPDQTDKLGFLNIPGRCTIEIYTELGELVDTLTHEDGSGDEFWDHTTSARQVIASGIYIAVITNLDTSERVYEKFIIIR